jgi:hypothetical protein
MRPLASGLLGLTKRFDIGVAPRAFFGEVDSVRRQKMRHSKEEMIPRQWKQL